ncbi:MAG: hypothetical protein C0490_13525 [Marivirga sp.]|nr:hypothetical protein [Marivirga sp.]
MVLKSDGFLQRMDYGFFMIKIFGFFGYELSLLAQKLLTEHVYITLDEFLNSWSVQNNDPECIIL